MMSRGHGLIIPLLKSGVHGERYWQAGRLCVDERLADFETIGKVEPLR